MKSESISLFYEFLSTLPARGATLALYPSIGCIVVFLSTLPARGATIARTGRDFPIRISIHAPREGSDPPKPPSMLLISLISIHAPREGSDAVHDARRLDLLISIHAPREGSDGMDTVSSEETQRFLSTLPARGATNGHGL